MCRACTYQLTIVRSFGRANGHDAELIRRKPCPRSCSTSTYFTNRTPLQAVTPTENTFFGRWSAVLLRLDCVSRRRSAECRKDLNIGRPRSRKRWRTSEGTIWQLPSKTCSNIWGGRWSSATSASLWVSENHKKIYGPLLLLALPSHRESQVRP